MIKSGKVVQLLLTSASVTISHNLVLVFPAAGRGTARMVELSKVKAVLALLYEIAELERELFPITRR